MSACAADDARGLLQAVAPRGWAHVTQAHGLECPEHAHLQLQQLQRAVYALATARLSESPALVNRGPSFALSTLRYTFVWGKGVINRYSSTRVSLWDSLMFGRLAMGFANVRASRYGIR